MRILIALFAILLTVPVSAQGQDADIAALTLADVLEGLRANESRIQSLSVKQRAKNERVTPEIFVRRFNAKNLSTRSSHQEQWHVAASGAGWNRGTEQTVNTTRDGTTTKTASRYHNVFDGTSGLAWSGTLVAGKVEGQQAQKHPALIRSTLSPLDFTTHHGDLPVSKQLVDFKAAITGRDEWEGRSAILIQTQSVEHGQFEYKTEFWVVPELSFAVVRRHNLNRDTTKEDSDFVMSSSIDSFKHKEIEPNVWLPSIVFYRTYDRSPESDDGKLLSRSCDVFCSNWVVNKAIPEEELRMEIPTGLRVHGMLEEFQANLKVRKSYFIRPVTTSLQRMLLGKASAYAEIDVASFVDVNTQQITPAQFDWGSFRADLEAVASGLADGDAKRTLYLKKDFGGLSSDPLLGTFIHGPLETICKNSGFDSVRQSNSYHNDNKLWKKPEEDHDDEAEEDNLGNESLSIYPVRTALSKQLLGGIDVLIERKSSIAKDAKEFLDQAAKDSITKAFRDHSAKGKTVTAKFIVGNQNGRGEGDPKLPHHKQDSEMQIELVDFLRKLGFATVRIETRQGFQVFRSTYRLDD